MGKGYKFCPAVPFSWIREMRVGIRGPRVQITASTIGVILALNTAYRTNKSPNGITLPHALLAEFAVSRYTTTKTLNLLEKSGLVKLERRIGCSIKITLLHRPPDKVKIGKGGAL